MPFDVVDDALAHRLSPAAGAGPARVVIYLLLAGCLLANLGYEQVWARLSTGLKGIEGLEVARPSGSALRRARRRLTAAPLRAIFDLLRGRRPPASGQGCLGGA